MSQPQRPDPLAPKSAHSKPVRPEPETNLPGARVPFQLPRSRGVLMSYTVVLAIVILGLLAMGGFGGWDLYAQLTGTKVTATVDHCNVTRYDGGKTTEMCTGHWVIEGKAVTGEVNHAASADLNTSFEATVHGGTAYKRDLTSPIVLFGFGLAGIAGAIWYFARGREQLWEKFAPLDQPQSDSADAVADAAREDQLEGQDPTEGR